MGTKSWSCPFPSCSQPENSFYTFLLALHNYQTTFHFLVYCVARSVEAARQPESILTRWRGAPASNKPSGLGELGLFLKAQQHLRYRQCMCTPKKQKFEQCIHGRFTPPAGTSHLQGLCRWDTHPEDPHGSTHRSLRLFPAEGTISAQPLLQREGEICATVQCPLWTAVKSSSIWQWIDTWQAHIGLLAMSEQRVWLVESS